MKTVDFLLELESVRTIILRMNERALKNLSDFQFEQLVYDHLCSIFSPKDDVIYKVGSTSFPDIVYLHFGIEVKTTNKNSWVSLGNSIMEGTKRETAKEIFIFFLKKGGKPDIRIRKYEECLSDIKVTHSPRYEIKMDLEQNKTIFNEMGTTYQDFSKSTQKIKMLRNFYKKHTQGNYPWWIDPKSGETVTSINFQNYAFLSSQEKSNIIVELLSLFPEIVSGKYDAAAVYLISKYGVYNKSFRDIFSAGGQITINNDVRIPQVFKHIHDNIADIKYYLELNISILNEFWDDKINRTNVFQIWLTKIMSYIPQQKIKDENPSHTAKFLSELLREYVTN